MSRPAQSGERPASATSRRGMLGALGLAASAAVLPAVTLAAPAGTSPFRIAADRYRAALHRYNNLPKNLESSDPVAFAEEQRRYDAALDAVDTAPVASWQEFGEAFEIACDGGYSLPNEELVEKLLADVRRLNGRLT